MFCFLQTSTSTLGSFDLLFSILKNIIENKLLDFFLKLAKFLPGDAQRGAFWPLRALLFAGSHRSHIYFANEHIRFELCSNFSKLPIFMVQKF